MRALFSGGGGRNEFAPAVEGGGASSEFGPEALKRAAGFKVAVLIATLLTLLAAGLRFSVLDAGLRHEPHSDERVFVEEAQAMVSRGDWKPRYFEYPGLLIWVFKALFLAFDPVGPQAYVVARAFVAASSSLAVFMVAFLGCRWFSAPAGLLAGMLLALSPVCVHTAHTVRPDAVIHGLIFAALAAGAPLKGAPRPALAWFLGAVAVSVKFSAALVFPALLLAALLDRLRPLRIVGLGSLAAVSFFVLSPWTLLGREDSLGGVFAQLGYHYSSQVESLLPSLAHHLTHTLPLALSWPGIGLALVGLMTFLTNRRGFVWVAFIGLWILVFSSTDVSFIRFMVPVLGALSLLAAAGFVALLARSRKALRPALAVWAGAALLISGFEVGEDIRGRARPSTQDRALDWLQARPGLAHVGSMEHGLGRFSRSAPDIVDLTPSHLEDHLLLRQLDALILPVGASAPGDFIEAARFSPRLPGEGRELVAFVHPAPPRFAVQPLERNFLRTSAPNREHHLLEPSLKTRWRADSSPAFIEVTLPEAVNLARVELRYGPISRGRDQVSRVFVDGARVPFTRVRGPVHRQRRDRVVSELLAFRASLARTIRIELEGEPPFIASELKVYTTPPEE